MAAHLSRRRMIASNDQDVGTKFYELRHDTIDCFDDSSLGGKIPILATAIGRFDGENYNIGFLDICNRPHKPLCQAAIKSHEAVYDIASGDKEPYKDAPEYLPKLFL